jgi:hypothetical protein
MQLIEKIDNEFQVKKYMRRFAALSWWSEN